MPADLPRFFVDGQRFGEPGALVHLEGPVCRQLSLVLKLRPGSRVILLDGAGQAREASLVAIRSDRVVAELGQLAPCAPEPPVAVTLMAAVLKGEHQELLIQKAVELGAARIQPLLTERSVARAEGGKPERWRRIAREAAEQCERAIVPEIGDPIALIEAVWPGGRALACTERDGSPIGGLLSLQDRSLSVFIGPEGGWTPRERSWLAEQGAQAASLGPRILRAETAALAALCAVMAHLCWPLEFQL